MVSQIPVCITCTRFQFAIRTVKAHPISRLTHCVTLIPALPSPLSLLFFFLKIILVVVVVVVVVFIIIISISSSSSSSSS